MFQNIGVSILSWKAPQTLNATLDNYQSHKLFDLFGDVCLTLPEMSLQDKKIAEKFNLRYKGYAHNLGILGGMKAGANSLKTEYILLLENDCPIVSGVTDIKEQLKTALAALDSGAIDVMYLRHRFKRGEQFSSIRKYTRFFDVKEEAPGFLLHQDISKDGPFIKWCRRTFYRQKANRLKGMSVFIEKHPEKLFPKYIRKHRGLFVIDSYVLPWTNQSVLLKKDLFLTFIDYAEKHPSSRRVNGFSDLEKEMNRSWWRHRHYKIGLGAGIFTHARLDNRH